MRLAVALTIVAVSVLVTSVAAAQTSDPVVSRVTPLVYKSDFEGAERMLQTRIDQLQARNSREGEAELRDLLVWLRWSKRDFDGALGANDQLEGVAAALRPDVRSSVLRRYWWNRACLFAGQWSISSLRGVAFDARRHFQLLADKVKDHYKLAVLDVLFAYAYADSATALKLANEARIGSDGDPLDLYLVLQAIGTEVDSVLVKALRAKIDKAKESPIKALILHHNSGTAHDDDAILQSRR